ncbi:unnamed protein product [Peniophora sp. CBMAI 1063]|nr:unnamed protein product [Peniophora sp. CBMAI 1063]
MKAHSFIPFIVSYVLVATSSSHAGGHLRRNSFSSPNGMKMQPVPAMTSPSGSSVTGLMNIQDSYYFLNITLGGSVFTVQLDTGSTDLVLSPDRPIKTTSVIKGSNVTDMYGTGFFSGTLAFADLEVGGQVIKSQVFINATSVGDFQTESMFPLGIRGILGAELSSYQFSGIRDELNDRYGAQKGGELGRNILANIFNQHPNLGNFTTIVLGRSDDGESAGESYFAIGEYPERLKDSFSNTAYIDTIIPTDFDLFADTVSVNGKAVSLNSSIRGVPRGKAIANLDSGTSTALVPRSVVDAMYGGIPGALYSDPDQTWIVPCLGDAPNITITLGGKEVYIHPLDLTTVLDLRPDDNFTVCMGTFSVLDSAFAADVGVDWILGDSYLRNVYTSYYYGSFNATGGLVKSPALKLIPAIDADDIDATYSDFLTRRRQNLASLAPEGTQAQIKKRIAEATANASASAAAVENIASGGSSDSVGGSYQSLLNKLDVFGPIVFGLLGAIFVVLLGLLGVGVTLCIRRGRTVGVVRSADTMYAPVTAPMRFKEPVPEYRDEENASYGQ